MQNNSGQSNSGRPPAEAVRLIDRDGVCARLTLPAEGQPAVAVLDSGKAVRVPPALMVRQDSGAYSVAARFDDLPEESPAPVGQAALDQPERAPMPQSPMPEDPTQKAEMAETEAGMIIPVVAEEVRVRKERTVTGKIRLRKIVHHEEQTLDEPLLRERVSVERVAIDQWVDEVPPIRHEGETLVVPVVEEVLVVEKRLRLREEVRVTWHHEEEHEPQTLVVRREEVRLERTADENPNPANEDRKQRSDAGG